MPKFLCATPFALAVGCSATAARADDWVANKLRGEAFVLNRGDWVRIKRGDIVSNSAAVPTMSDGQVEFVRDHETITLGPDTQIQKFDRSGQRYTNTGEPYPVVENIGRAVESLRFEVRKAKIAVTASLGNSETETTAKALKDSDGRADEAFYVSKSEGRNRCVKGVPRMLPPRDLNSTSANVPFHETSNAQS